MAKSLKVLLIVEACNPDGASVPLVGYRLYDSLFQRAEVTLITHGRNRKSLQKHHPDRDIIYLDESNFSRRYYRLAAWLSCFKGRVIWPLRQALTYPIYGEFNQQVYSRFAGAIAQGTYDIVHAMTPVMPRYPVKVSRVCGEDSPSKTPFILGPVNGGIPFPEGFSDIAKREFTGLNFLRVVGRFLIPDYRATYQRAAAILSGSAYTTQLITDLFDLPPHKVKLFHENGLEPSFLAASTGTKKGTIKPTGGLKLLFVGRLVPYKGADMLIDAIAQIPAPIRNQLHLTIVGDGAERIPLEQQVQARSLTSQVTFTGWIPQEKTLHYYQKADVFCFPSVREFGGAVVLEAMGNGLPCIVVNYGGIGEYTTDKTGFKIPPISREFVVRQLSKHIAELAMNPALRADMSQAARHQAQQYAWPVRADAIIDIYQQSIAAREPANSPRLAGVKF
ncbi:MAG: glycosyltransferase family 4 protein [Cyanobacteria bacterium J06631_9]